MNQVKESTIKSEIYFEKIEERISILENIAHIIEIKEEYKVNKGKILWSSTHIQNVLECEKWWFPEFEAINNKNTQLSVSVDSFIDNDDIDSPQAKRMRTNSPGFEERKDLKTCERNLTRIQLSNRLHDEELLNQLEDLSTWILERRFVFSQWTILMGGFIVLEMLQVCHFLQYFHSIFMIIE